MNYIGYWERLQPEQLQAPTNTHYQRQLHLAGILPCVVLRWWYYFRNTSGDNASY